GGVGADGAGTRHGGRGIGVGWAVRNRQSVARMFEEALIAYGGVDSVVVTAGVFVPPDKTGRIEDRLWEKTFAINVTGAYLVADEANKIFKRQGVPRAPRFAPSAPPP